MQYHKDLERDKKIHERHRVEAREKIIMLENRVAELEKELRAANELSIAHEEELKSINLHHKRVPWHWNKK